VATKAGFSHGAQDNRRRSSRRYGPASDMLACMPARSSSVGVFAAWRDLRNEDSMLVEVEIIYDAVRADSDTVGAPASRQLFCIVAIGVVFQVTDNDGHLLLHVAGQPAERLLSVTVYLDREHLRGLGLGARRRHRGRPPSLSGGTEPVRSWTPPHP